MKSVISIFLFFSSMCSPLNKDQQGLTNSEFVKIVESYINNYSKISNPCNAKPIYEIYFENENDSLGFWIGAYLGKPSRIPPSAPDAVPLSNPKEIKGVTYINKRPVIIFDYKNSKGYGLYNSKDLIECEKVDFDELSEFCINVNYPEGFYFRIKQDSIYLEKKRAEFHLQ